MCFLKNLSHKLSRQLPSAFKKVEVEHPEPAAESSEDEAKQQETKQVNTRENSEVAEISTGSEITEVQRVQLRYLMELLQANTSVAWTLLEVHLAICSGTRRWRRPSTASRPSWRSSKNGWAGRAARRRT